MAKAFIKGSSFSDLSSKMAAIMFLSHYISDKKCVCRLPVPLPS